MSIIHKHYPELLLQRSSPPYTDESFTRSTKNGAFVFSGRPMSELGVVHELKSSHFPANQNKLESLVCRVAAGRTSFL